MYLCRSFRSLFVLPSFQLLLLFRFSTFSMGLISVHLSYFFLPVSSRTRPYCACMPSLLFVCALFSVPSPPVRVHAASAVLLASSFLASPLSWPSFLPFLCSLIPPRFLRSSLFRLFSSLLSFLFSLSSFFLFHLSLFFFFFLFCLSFVSFLLFCFFSFLLFFLSLSPKEKKGRPG